LLNKRWYRDPRVFPAWEALRMATIEGAQAVGLGDEVGSPETGKHANALTELSLSAMNAPNDKRACFPKGVVSNLDLWYHRTVGTIQIRRSPRRSCSSLRRAM
jgi:hypothetical protein